MSGYREPPRFGEPMGAWQLVSTKGSARARADCAATILAGLVVAQPGRTAFELVDEAIAVADKIAALTAERWRTVG